MNINEALTNYDRGKHAAHFAAIEQERKEMLRRFPLESWPEMRLEDYAVGQDDSKSNFCWWLEFGSTNLGSMKGGSASKLLIFKFRTGVWRFESKYRNESEAWTAIRAGFVQAFELAAANQLEQVDEIEALRGGSALRTKALHLYFRDMVLPVYSKAHICHFLRKLDRAGEADLSQGVIYLNQRLLERLRQLPETEGLGTDDLARFLYGWAHPQKDEESGKPAIEISEEQMAMLWKRFHRRIKNFTDFTNPGEQFVEEELKYKRRILERYQEELGNDRVREMIDRGEAAEVVKKLERIATTNLVHFTSWRKTLGETPQQNAEMLGAFLEVTSKTFERPSDLRLLRETRLEQGIKHSWDVYSVLLWMMRPEDYFPVKISYYRKLAEELGIELPKGGPGPNNIAKVLEFGRAFEQALEEYNPRDWIDIQSFMWCVRPIKETENTVADEEEGHEVDQELDEEETATSAPLNQILYGPPGTGKTFSTMRMAVEIIDGDTAAPDDATELKQRFDTLFAQSRIGFVTFHQSYSYEDFVEGIRPIMGNEASAMPRYECRDGMFKRMCVSARAGAPGPRSGSDIDPEKVAIWKMSLGNTLDPELSHVYDDCIQNGYMAHGAARGHDFKGCDDPESIRNAVVEKLASDELSKLQHEAHQVHRFKNEIAIGDLVVVSDGNYKFRAIGRVTGEYLYNPDLAYPQTRAMEWLRVFDESQPKERLLRNKNFSQLTLYKFQHEDLELDVLRQILGQVEAGPVERYVLIIDEINRGNISKILGELITLLDSDKRKGAANELTVTLPYSQSSFSVPNNLYVIGTMNTADKSIALVDSALRRRFVFKELAPEFSVCPSLSPVMSSVVAELNSRIAIRKDRDHRIGHSYFMDVSDELSFNRVFEDCVLPLLQDYFHTDWEGLRYVLGEHGKKNGRFIKSVDEQDSRMARNKWIWFRDCGDLPFDYLGTLRTQYGLEDTDD